MSRAFRIALLAIAVPALAAAAAPPQFDTARISHDIEVLASDAFEGRAPASAGEDKSAPISSRG